MLRLFSPKKENENELLSRYDRTLELQPIKLILDKLRAKEVELRNTTSEKHTIISFLLAGLDNSIAEFNETKPHSNHHDDINDLLELLNSFKVAIADVIEHNAEDLAFRRNNNKKVANTVTAATPLAAASSAVALGFLTGVTGGLALVAAGLLGTAYYLTSSVTPETVLILDELQNSVERAINTLHHISHNYSCGK